MDVVYCSKNATGNNDGSSWENAFISLQDALEYCNSDNDVQFLHIENNKYENINITINNSYNIYGEYYIEKNYNSVIIDASDITILSKMQINNCDFYNSTINTNYNLIIKYFVINNCTLTLTNICNLINGEVITSNFNISNGTSTFDTINIYNTNKNIILNDVNFNITKSNIISNTTTITSDNSFITINESLINGNKALDIINNNRLLLANSTINNGINLLGDNNYLDISTSLILYSYDNSYNYTLYSRNSTYYNTTFNINVNNNIILTSYPSFVDEIRNDYRVFFGVGINLDKYELTNDNELLEHNYKAQSLTTYNINISEYSYNINDVFTLTDYKKEIMFANDFNHLNISTLEYQISFYKKHIMNDVITESAFPYNEINDSSDPNIWPYEWTYERIYNGKTEMLSRIIPKSIIDITDIINSVFFMNPKTVTIDNLRVYAFKEKIIHGITYDYNNSSDTRKIIWKLTNDEVLIKMDLYQGSIINTYNLLSKIIPEKKYIIPISGVIPYTKYQDGYKYSLESNPNTIINGVDENYNFEWLPTDRIYKYDLYGILIYKNNLYISGNRISDNTPVILIYDTKGVYLDYTTIEPYIIELNIPNLYPTDLTVLEDGSFLIANKINKKLYNFVLQYDYGMIVSSDIKNTKILLREQYNDVQLTQ